jgi:hypothetical protein
MDDINRSFRDQQLIKKLKKLEVKNREQYINNMLILDARQLLYTVANFKETLIKEKLRNLLEYRARIKDKLSIQAVNSLINTYYGDKLPDDVDLEIRNSFVYTYDFFLSYVKKYDRQDNK